MKPFSNLHKARELLTRRGWRKIGLRLSERRAQKSYQNWIEKCDTPTDARRAMMREQIENFAHRPTISILLPVYNVEERWLRFALESVLRQIYENWELCVADDNSDKPHVRRVLQEFAARDERIKIVFRETNGHISAASNSALELATGEFCALLDHDDELAENALFEVVAAINDSPRVDLIYSDEDMLSENGRRYKPKFKPDWSPHFFRSLNLITHLAVYRTRILREINGFQIGAEGSQDYDLSLRFIERIAPENIVHIPKILYHWRAISGSVALDSGEKSYAHERARTAIAAHLARTKVAATVEKGFADFHRVRYALAKKDLSVSLILNGDISSKTDYQNYELLTVLRDGENLVEQLNSLAARATGDVLIFLQNDLRAVDADWLRELASLAIQPEVGAVGAKLLFPNQTLRSAGIVLGIKGLIGFAERGLPVEADGNLYRAQLAHNVSAVSGVCFAVARRKFEQVGGFDSRLNKGLFDVDLCLKLLKSNYYNVWTPFATLIQPQDSPTEKLIADFRRGRHSAETDFFAERWTNELQSDAFYNPNLTVDADDFGVKKQCV